MKCCIADCSESAATVYYGFALCEECHNEARTYVYKTSRMSKYEVPRAIPHVPQDDGTTTDRRGLVPSGIDPREGHTMKTQFCEWQSGAKRFDDSQCRRPTRLALTWENGSVPVCPIHARKLAERLEALAEAS